MKEKDNLDLDKFDKIMDEFIEKNEIQMLIRLPEGTNKAEVEDNTGAGPVLQFYIVLQCVQKIVNDMIDMVGGVNDKGAMIDDMLGLLKESIMSEKE